jgi:uncharacterized protein (TIGR02118 family)
MLKVITLLKRRPGLSVEEFQARWRKVHADLAAGVAGVRRYVQSHALLQGYQKGELIYDGIGEAWFDSFEAFDAAAASPEFGIASRDLSEFTDVSRTVVMPVDVHVIKDGAIPEGAVKNIEFVNRRPGIALDAFRRYWREVHGPIASRIAVVRRYEQNHVKAAVYAISGSVPFDGLAITWFGSTAEMKRGTTTPEYAITRADEPNFLPDGHLPIIITREHVIIG